MVNMTFKLRYYAPRLKATDYIPLPEEHKKIIGLLKLLLETHKIESEIKDLSMKDESIPSEMIGEMRAYEREFLPRKQILKKRTGASLSVLKKYGFPNVSGTIAITRNGEIEWYAIRCREFNEYDQDFRVGFLKMFLDKGPRLLSRLCSPNVDEGLESKILRKFISSGTLKGDFLINFKVGLTRIQKEASSRFMPEFGCFRNSQDNRLLSKLRWIDAVCLIKNTAWVLEVEKRLNEIALGQVLIYRNLFSEDFSPEDFPRLKHIKAGIVCMTSHDWIMDICKDYDVQVFVA